jgi:hypothetical protein
MHGVNNIKIELGSVWHNAIDTKTRVPRHSKANECNETL